MSGAGLLKEDLFGRVERIEHDGRPAVQRDISGVRWWIAPLARWMLRREARALAALAAAPPHLQARLAGSLPQLVELRRDGLLRSWLDGRPMQKAQPSEAHYYREARRLLCALHSAGITHNDDAKEQNWLVLNDGRPALIDFQLAVLSSARRWNAGEQPTGRARRRSRFFRLLAREDLRHLCKHKRKYCPRALTPREQRLLEQPSRAARLLRAGPKRAYSFVTRRLLGWRDDEGRG
ncbi:MAG: serine/threonine protein kinase [Planctomycetota bacterium]